MSNIEIQQQDVKALAAGYSKWFRLVEILSIASFWTLTFAVIWRVLPFRHSQPWVIVAAACFGFILADFVSGFVHWAADTWGSTEMPILGKALIRPFREHHIDPKAMTKHDYIETNGANCMISVPWAAGMMLVPLTVGSPYLPYALFVVVSITSMIFWVMMTNQIHKWAHIDEAQTPGWLKWAQRLHLVMPPSHHDRHHTAPYDTYYCITTGWLNWPLHTIGFYRFMERVLMATTGMIPRRDDIGLVAALKIAPAPVTLPLPGNEPNKLDQRA